MLPAVFGFREFAVAGDLISYGASPGGQLGIAASMSAHPQRGIADHLPVQQSTKVELIVISRQLVR